MLINLPLIKPRNSSSTETKSQEFWQNKNSTIRAYKIQSNILSMSASDSFWDSLVWKSGKAWDEIVLINRNIFYYTFEIKFQNFLSFWLNRKCLYLLYRIFIEKTGDEQKNLNFYTLENKHLGFATGASLISKAIRLCISKRNRRENTVNLKLIDRNQLGLNIKTEQYVTYCMWQYCIIY